MSCRFYGRAAVTRMRLLAESGGNQCALKYTAHSPCQMEIAGQKPSWDDCPLKEDPMLRVFAADVRLYQIVRATT